MEENIEEMIKNFFNQQMQCYKQLSELQSLNTELQVDSETGEVIFEEGTLIHCARECNYEKLQNIKNKGIMSGDFIGKPEAFSESFYCADFYRAHKEMRSTDFFEMIQDSDEMDNRGPFSPSWKNCLKLAFVIQPKSELKPLLDSDMYRKENSDHVMQKKLNLLEEYKDEKNGQIAAIPYGMPSSAFSGIVAGDFLLQNEKYMSVIRNMFPNCYILSREGKVYFDPNLIKEENENRKAECLEGLQQFRQKYVESGNKTINKYLENALKFSEQEIGKATINVNTLEKDASMKKINEDMQEIVNEKQETEK